MGAIQGKIGSGFRFRFDLLEIHMIGSGHERDRYFHRLILPFGMFQFR